MNLSIHKYQEKCLGQKCFIAVPKNCFFLNWLELLVSDEDECRLKIAKQCSHECINTLGSYRCSCPDGYETRGKYCDGKSLSFTVFHCNLDISQNIFHK